MLRIARSPAQGLGQLAQGVTDDQIMDAMVAHPIQVNRPINCTPKGGRLCRPSETRLDLLDRLPQAPLANEDGQLIIDAEGNRLASNAD